MAQLVSACVDVSGRGVGVGVCVDVSGRGVGVCVDMSGRSVAQCRSVKRAYQLAVENAFSRLLLVVLDNGKVFVDVISDTGDAHSLVTAADNDDCQSQILPVFCSHDLQVIFTLLSVSVIVAFCPLD